MCLGYSPQQLDAMFFRNMRSGVYLGKKGREVAVFGRVLHCGSREQVHF